MYAWGFSSPHVRSIRVIPLNLLHEIQAFTPQPVSAASLPTAAWKRPT